jgi:hypothetical protein
MLFNEAADILGYITLVTGELISLARLWNDTDRGEQKYSERNLSQCYFVHRNFHRTGLILNLRLCDIKPETA